MCMYSKDRFLPYVIEAKTTQEYFDLPKEKREKYGLYLLPLGLTVNFGGASLVSEWDVFSKEIRKHYPIQWFFRMWCFSWSNPIYSTLTRLGFRYRDAKYAAKNFISPSFPRWRKTIKRHQSTDLTWLVIESNLNSLLDFWYEEVVDGWVNWNSDEQHKTFYKQLKTYVNWIEKKRPALQKKMDQTLALTGKNRKKKYEAYDKLEQQSDNMEEEIVIWMVKNRNFLWS